MTECNFRILCLGDYYAALGTNCWDSHPGYRNSYYHTHIIVRVKHEKYYTHINSAAYCAVRGVTAGYSVFCSFNSNSLLSFR
jgi:hypothetical protein